MLHMQPPTFHNLNVFGCLFYASTLTNARTTFDPPAIKCMFLGFKLGTKGSLLFDLHTRNTFIFRNVFFMNQPFLTMITVLVLLFLFLIYHMSLLYSLIFLSNITDPTVIMTALCIIVKLTIMKLQLLLHLILPMMLFMINILNLMRSFSGNLAGLVNLLVI
jgi:hypothetical protein